MGSITRYNWQEVQVSAEENKFGNSVCCFVALADFLSNRGTGRCDI